MNFSSDELFNLCLQVNEIKLFAKNVKKKKKIRSPLMNSENVRYVTILLITYVSGGGLGFGWFGFMAYQPL